MNNKKSNNPFESGKTTSPFEGGNRMPRSNFKTKQAEVTFNKQKRNKPGLIIIFIIAIIIGIIIASNWWKVHYYFKELESLRNVESVEIIDDYTFDITDMDAEYSSNPFPTKPSTGKALTINQNSDGLLPSDDYFEITLIAGKDFEPGVYTINEEGKAYVYMDTSVRQYIDLEENQAAYNIPFLPGDELKITIPDKEEQFEIHLTPQNSYIEYQSNQPGIYVYGLSNFESKIELDKDDYNSVLYCYPLEGSSYDSQDCELFYGKTINLNGGAGTYFAIDYNN